jgi:signal transduction histidine kinase
MVTRLRSRMIRSGLVLVVAILAVAGVTTGILFAKEVRANARLRLTAQTETMIISLSDRLIEHGQLTGSDVERLAPEGTEVVLRDSTGVVVARTGPVLAAAVMSIEVQGPGNLSASVSADRAPVDRRVRQAWNTIVAVALGIAALAALAALFEARQLSRPLDRLARAAVQIGAGDAGVVAPRSGLVEVDAIAEALEERAKRVAELVNAERQFSANASHQLRSPLTAIAISLELIADSSDPIARREAAEALTQVAGLDDRINELLKLARTGRVAARSRVDVAALVGRHIDAVAAQFQRAGRRLSLVAPDVVEAEVTPGALTQSVEILLDNALLHGTGDVEVTVSGNDAGVVEIAIRDEGRIVDSSDPNDGGAIADHHGHGFGLLLARNLLRPDGGRVELVSAAPTMFVITLPEQPSVRPSSSASSPAVRTQSGSHLLTHEDRVGDGEQHNDSTNESGHLPPGQNEALGKRKRARQGLRRGVVLDDEPG